MAEIIFTSHDDKSLTSIQSNSRRSDDSDNGSNISGSDERQNDDENELESESESGDGKEVVFVKGKSDTGDDDSDDDNFFANAEDQEEQKKRIQEMNENALVFYVCHHVTDGERCFWVMMFPKLPWYLQYKCFKMDVQFSYEKANKSIPYSIEFLNEHKLREEYSQSNTMIYPSGKNYPEVRWYTVIITSRINPKAELEQQLKIFTKRFKGLYSEKTEPSPGRRCMTYLLNSGSDKITDGLKKYMGQDESIIADKINSELIDLGKKPHRYEYKQTMDRFLPDYYIKSFLQDHLNSTSWESVDNRTKKACYKGYPKYKLPDWNKISI